jgi:hypothetical protein
MKTSEDLDAWSCSGWGIYSPQPPTSRWGRLLSMGAPDSPVHHRTGPVDCPVRRHVTQPLGFGSSWPLEALSSCGTRQSGATPDRSCSMFGAPLTSALTSVRHCSRTVAFAESTVVWVSRCSVGALDSSVAHRTVRWIIAEGTWKNPRVVGLSCTVLAHQTLSGGTPDSPVRCSSAHSSFFAPLNLNPNLNIYWFELNLCAPVERVF